MPRIDMVEVQRLTVIRLSILALSLLPTHTWVLPGMLSVKDIPGDYNVTGGYTLVIEDNEAQHFVPHGNGCMDHARAVREPYTSAYSRRTFLDELNVDIPLVFWGWQGNISRELFSATSKDRNVVRYKIVSGRIYTDVNFTGPPNQIPRKDRIEDLMKLAVYLFPIPDMEFLVSYDDACSPGRPIFTHSVCRNYTNPGFTMPSYSVWDKVLGQSQMAAYYACLNQRYPASQRKPLVVWRGSTTGRAAAINLEACAQLPRIRLHYLARQHTDILDARLTALVQPCGDLYKGIINDTAPYMQIELANNYCAILDMDGNSWSDRYATVLVHYNTPVLKQATNLTGYADHFFAPGHAAEHFDPGLVTLVDKARRMVADCARGDHSVGQRLARRSQTIARLLMDHVGVARSMAYGLVTYRRLSAWEPDRGVEGMRPLGRVAQQSTLPVELKMMMIAAAKDDGPLAA